MNISGGGQPHFGNVYKVFSEKDLATKQQELSEQGIEHASEYKSSSGEAQVINWNIYTDENGTSDLTDFQHRQSH